MRNYVAKYAAQFNKAGTHRAATDYIRSNFSNSDLIDMDSTEYCSKTGFDVKGSKIIHHQCFDTECKGGLSHDEALSMLKNIQDFNGI